jgi:hypothetical protein
MVSEVEPLAGEESLYFKELRPFTSFRVTQKKQFFDTLRSSITIYIFVTDEASVTNREN